MCYLLHTQFNILMYMVSFICTYILVDMARQIFMGLISASLFYLQKMCNIFFLINFFTHFDNHVKYLDDHPFSIIIVHVMDFI
jgi:hypothetical protein